MKEKITLRQLISQTLESNEFDLMVDYLFERDSKTILREDDNLLTREETSISYTKVVDELMMLDVSTPYHFPIFISWVNEDDYNLPGEPKTGEKYVDVGMINLNFVAPDPSLNPWGCDKEETPPEGYYNVNDEKHNKYFGFGLSPWSEIIDTEIICEIPELKDYEVLAEILWELTFYGWTQKKQEEFRQELDVRLEESRKEIDAGECITLPKKDGDKFSVVIPDCVQKQFSKKKTNNLSEGAD